MTGTLLPRLRRWWRDAFLFLLALVVLGLDQASKAWILNHLAEGQSLDPLPGTGQFLLFTHITNTGAVFGLFRDQTILFALIAVAVSVAIVVYYRYLPNDRFWIRASLGLQLGGALGNLVDRLHYGHVVDFINVGIGNLRWYVFNVADSSLVVGVVILALYLLTRGRDQERQ
jgi:signal peptidase II